jgi:putative transposase
MSNYRRYYVPGGTYFFTLVTQDRAPFLCTDAAREILRAKFQASLIERPFGLVAIVLLPDHLHTMWSLPEGDMAYPARCAWIKKEFTKSWLAAGGTEKAVSDSKAGSRPRGVWQRRYWVHTIRDEEDFTQQFNHIHYNPVKHGLVKRSREWPYSTFHRYVREGIYPPNWGEGPQDIGTLEDAAMEWE